MKCLDTGVLKAVRGHPLVSKEGKVQDTEDWRGQEPPQLPILSCTEEPRGPCQPHSSAATSLRVSLRDPKPPSALLQGTAPSPRLPLSSAPLFMTLVCFREREAESKREPPSGRPDGP